MTAAAPAPADAPVDVARLIDAHIAALGGWRAEALAALRVLVHEAVPDVVEEWKWRIPVWSCAGILCTGEAYKATVKLTFPQGASLPDPTGLFNASLEGKVRRAIDLREGQPLDREALKTLLQAAASANRARRR